MARALPAPGDHRAEFVFGRHERGAQLLAPGVLQRAAEQGLDLVHRAAVHVALGRRECGHQRLHARVLRHRGGLHPDRHPSHLFEPAVADPLAHLVYRPFSGRMAGRSGLLPDFADDRPYRRARRYRDRQPRPAHLRRFAGIRPEHAFARAWFTVQCCVAVQLRGHPLGPVGRDDGFWRQYPRVYGLGSTCLCHSGHLADASCRPPAGWAEFPPAAGRGRFPLCPGAAARKYGGHRPAWR